MTQNALDSRMRVLITGGSGFIGTNAVEFYSAQVEAVCSLDICEPRRPDHRHLFKKVDLLDRDSMIEAVAVFKPTHVLHLGAATGMDSVPSGFFDPNTVGTQNLIDACSAAGSVEHVIFTSSLLVCKNGYIPQGEQDYCPPNQYGESKRDMEILVQSQGDRLPFRWTIIRPTAMWGPWFEVPYSIFFKTVINRLYVNPGSREVVKSICYVGNGLHIINKIFQMADERVEKRVFYLVDIPQVTVREWANTIQEELGRQAPVPTIPMPLMYLVASMGTLLKKVIGVDPPLTLFRLRNMMTEMKMDLIQNEALFGPLPFSNRAGVRATIQWLGEQSSEPPR